MRRRHLLQVPLVALASPLIAREAPIDAVAEYERRSGGHIGVYAKDLRTGSTLSWRADQRFVMCSTFKASLAACMLSRVDRGQDRLDTPIRYGIADLPDWHAPVARANLAKGWLSLGDMCAAAVEQSDNTCATLLLTRIGGPAALTSFWRRTGDDVTRLDDPEVALNFRASGDTRDTTTPAAMAHTLRRLVLGGALSEVSRQLLTGWLIGCRTGGNRLRAGLPPSWRIGDKTGNNGQDAAGDIAIAWPDTGAPIVMSVYTRGGSPTQAQLEAAFAGIGRHIATRLRT